MLQLQKHLLPFHRFASPIHLSLSRALLSTGAAASSPAHFAAEDYLVTNCGLTKEQAAKTAKYIAHCKSPSNADAVLAFLAGPALGLSKADIAVLVSNDARILNCSVEKTLRTRIDGFLSHGFTTDQIRSFIRRVPFVFRSFNINEKLGFWMPFLGSPEKFLLIVRRNFYLVTSDLDKVIKTNIELLRESGLSVPDITKMCVANPRLLTSNPDSVRGILVRADALGVPRNSLMFRQAVGSVAGLGPETMAAKLKFMGETLGWSDAEVARAVKMSPVLLRCSKEKLKRVSDFLIKVVGVDSKYILHRPSVLMYSLERRLGPRHFVMKMLVKKGLMRKDQSFYTMVTIGDELFRSRYINPHKDVLPGLADAYTSACEGKIPNLIVGL